MTAIEQTRPVISACDPIRALPARHNRNSTVWLSKSERGRQSLVTHDRDRIMSVAESRTTHLYSQEDIQQILQIAIARQASEGEFSREQLFEIAAELDISPECLQAAEWDWIAQQGQLQKRQAFNTYRQRRLKRHLSKYLIVNSFLVTLNVVSTNNLSWSVYVLLGWGLILTLQAWNTHQSQGEEYEKAFRKWHRKHQLRQSLNRIWSRWFRT